MRSEIPHRIMGEASDRTNVVSDMEAFAEGNGP